MATVHGETPATPEVAGTLIPEDIYNATAVTAGTRTEDLLRYAAEEHDEGDQIVYLLEHAAQQLAEMGMTLRVVARHLAQGNVPGADRTRLEELAKTWQRGDTGSGRRKLLSNDQQRMAEAAIKACGLELQHFLDGEEL